MYVAVICVALCLSFPRYTFPLYIVHTEFVNFYTTAFMFLWNMFGNNFPLKSTTASSTAKCSDGLSNLALVSLS